jgi:hypothetical protein
MEGAQATLTAGTHAQPRRASADPHVASLFVPAFTRRATLRTHLASTVFCHFFKTFVEEAMLRFVVLLAPLLILSGCCRVFGICTSVDVHTSIDRPQNVAQQKHFPETISDSAFSVKLATPSASACRIASR